MNTIVSTLLGLMIATVSPITSESQVNATYLIETSQMSELQSKYDLNVKEKIEGKEIYQVEIENPKETESIMKEEELVFLGENKKIGFLETNQDYPSDGTSPNYLSKMNFPQKLYGDQQTTIAVLDTGIDYSHPILVDYIVPGFNAYEDDLPQDDEGHGTHVAGIIAMDSPNSIKIMPIKVLDQYGDGDIFSIVEGLYFAIEQGADIINMSFGAPYDHPAFREAVQEAVSKGIIIVAATGNGGGTPVYFPAGYDQVLGIGSIDNNGEKSTFSQYGEGVDFVAPGEKVESTYLGGGYKVLSGTSMAAPMVSRALGYLYAENTYLKNEKALSLLKTSSNDLNVPGKDIYTGFGIIDVNKVITASFDYENNHILDLYDSISSSKKKEYESHVENYYGRLIE